MVFDATQREQQEREKARHNTKRRHLFQLLFQTDDNQKFFCFQCNEHIMKIRVWKMIVHQKRLTLENKDFLLKENWTNIGPWTMLLWSNVQIIMDQEKQYQDHGLKPNLFQLGSWSKAGFATCFLSRVYVQGDK
jgi:hypothetical protein